MWKKELKAWNIKFSTCGKGVDKQISFLPIVHKLAKQQIFDFCNFLLNTAVIFH